MGVNKNNAKSHPYKMKRGNQNGNGNRNNIHHSFGNGSNCSHLHDVVIEQTISFPSRSCI